METTKKELEFTKDHPKEFVIGSPSQGVITRSQSTPKEEKDDVPSQEDEKGTKIANNVLEAFLSQVEPKNYKEAEKDES